MARMFIARLTCLLSIVWVTTLSGMYQQSAVPINQSMMQSPYGQPGYIPNQPVAMAGGYNPAAAAPGAATGPGAGAPELSNEDMQFLNDLDAMIQNLSPEEKQQLDDMSKRMGERIDSMFAQDPSLQQRIQDDPTALESFLNTVITPEIEQIETSAAQQPTKPEAATEEKKEAAKEEPKKDINAEEKIKVLDSLIDLLDAFEVKTEGLPRFAEQYEKWVKDKRINYSDQAPTWKQFKEKMGIFKQIIHQLEQEEDPAAKIKTYKHIANLIADQDTWRSLEQLEYKLRQLIPLIKKEATSRVKDLSSEGKKAARETLSTILSGIHLQPKLEEIIKKYEKRAGELRAEEKKRQEKAFAETKKPKVTRPTTVIGRRGEEYPGYIPEPSYPRGGMYPWESGAHTQPWKPEAAEKKGKSSDKGKEKKKGTAAAGKEAKKSDEEKALDHAVEALLQALSNIQSLIDDNDELQNFSSYMVSDKGNYAQVAEALKMIDDQLVKAVHDTKITMRSAVRSVNEAAKKAAIKDIRDVLESPDNKPLKGLLSAISSIAGNPSSVRDGKKKSMFMGSERNRLAKELERKNMAIQEQQEQLKAEIEAAKKSGETAKQQAAEQKLKQLSAAKEQKLTGEVAIEEIPAHYEKLNKAIEDLAKVKQRASARKKEMARKRIATPEMPSAEKAAE